MSPLRDIAVVCPSCAEEMWIEVEELEGTQQFVEDCQVCCRPMHITVRRDREGNVSCDVKPEDG